MRDPCQLMFCSQPSLPPTQIIPYAEEWRADRLQATRAIESAHPAPSAPRPGVLHHGLPQYRGKLGVRFLGKLPAHHLVGQQTARRAAHTLQHPIHAALAVP